MVLCRKKIYGVIFRRYFTLYDWSNFQCFNVQLIFSNLYTYHTKNVPKSKFGRTSESHESLLNQSFVAFLMEKFYTVFYANSANTCYITIYTIITYCLVCIKACIFLSVVNPYKFDENHLYFVNRLIKFMFYLRIRRPLFVESEDF